MSIYDFYEANTFLDKLCQGNIQEVTPIGYSSTEKLPIRHFVYGTGTNHVVVTGCQHANEEISTMFVLSLMERLNKSNIPLDNVTVHFIPILNPEGYIVNTSAIKLKTGTLSDKELIRFYNDYYLKYRLDNISKISNIIKQVSNGKGTDKLHQAMFSDVKATEAITSDFINLRSNATNILDNHPKGAIIDWASNGNGVDLNSNSTLKQVKENQYNSKAAYNNIRLDIPSPIGYPGETSKATFQEESEITALRNIMKELNTNGNTLLGYFNYHSAGGMIYQEPVEPGLAYKDYNLELSKKYSEETKYNIIIDNNPNKNITAVDDDLRRMYPGNLLIELSTTYCNPFGPFKNPKTYNKTIEDNIKAFISTLSVINDNYQNHIILKK